MSLKSWAGQQVFRWKDWSYDERPELWSPQQVIVGFPHTTNLDGVRALAFLAATGRRAHVLVKQELFRPPLGSLLTRLDFIPVDRHASNDVVGQMAQRFAEDPGFSLVLAPEGTRGKDGVQKPIRTGFWHIARQAGVPILLMISDDRKRQIRPLARLMPTDLATDLQQIASLYAAEGVTLQMPVPRNP